MTLQFRRGTDSDRLGITPSAGEPIFTTDTKKMFIGDGSTAGGVEISGSIDSAATIALIDSAYVQARQSASSAFDSGNATGLIDSAYIQARQADLQRDSAFITNIIDSAYVLARAPAQDFLDSSEAINLIDSSYVQARQSTTDLTNYRTVTQIQSMIDSEVNGLVDAAPGALNTLNELAAALGDDANFSTTITNQIAQKVDSNNVIAIVDSAYVQARQSASSAFDSGNATGLIDSSYIQARQSTVSSGATTISTFNFEADSGQTTFSGADIDANSLTYTAGKLNVYLNGILLVDSNDYTATNGTSVVLNTAADSADIISVVSYITQSVGTLDSSGVTALIDSAYIQARQSTASDFDSSSAIALIDSAYIQARQVDLQRDSGFVTGIIDSAYINARASSFDSGNATGLIDSSYVQARQTAQDFAYSSLTGAPNVLDSANVVSLITANDQQRDSGFVTNIIDSAYVQARQSASSAFDSGNATGLIDSSYVQARQSTVSSGATTISTFNFEADSGQTTFSGADIDANSLEYTAGKLNVYLNGILLVDSNDYTATNGTSVVLGTAADSADIVTVVSYITQSVGTLDSAGVTNLIDSAYVLARAPAQDFLDSAEAINLIDSAYVQARQSTTDLTNYRTVTQIQTMIDSDIDALVDAAPGALNTLNELAAALGDDANFSATITGQIAALPDSAQVATIVTSYGYSTYDSSSFTGQLTNSVLRGILDDSSLTIDGNGSTGGVTIEDGGITIRTGTGSVAFADFYCETSNAHRTRVQSADHGSYSGNVDVTLPTSTGTLALTSDITIDSTGVINLIDSAYVQARQTSASGGLDSSATIALIDSAYVQARQTSGGGGGTDSATVISLINSTVDSDYVALRDGLNDSTTSFTDKARFYNFVADSGDTIFSGLSYTPGKVQVYLNGILLVDSADYVATNGTSVVLNSGVTDSGHHVNIVAYETLATGGATTITTTAFTATAGQTTFTTDYTAGKINVYLNGILLVDSDDYTASNGTSVVLSTAAVANDIVQVQKYTTGVVGTLDSAGVTNLIDSAYITARASTYDSGNFTGQLTAATGTSVLAHDANLQSFVDTFTLPTSDGSTEQALVTNGSGSLSFATLGSVTDSASTIALIDSAYVQARVTLRDSAFVTSIIDSSYVAARDNIVGTDVLAYDANLQSFVTTFTLPTSDGSANQVLVTDGSGTISFADQSGGLDSAQITSLVDSAYVAARGGGSGGGLDSAATNSLIDAKIQVTDVSDIVGADGGNGQLLKSLGNGNAEWTDLKIPEYAPAAATTQGTAGEISFDSAHLYVCIATNSWRRIAWTDSSW